MAIIVPSPLSLYCDASGNEREPLTVVGSVVASAEDWLAFISRWNDVLAQYGVEYFRASEFAHSRGQFKEGWKGNQSRRDALSHSLIETLIPTVKRWSGIAVLQSEFEKADRDYKLHENYQPFALAAETCIDDAFKWRAAVHLDYLPLKYFFEDGDQHWGQMSDRIKERFGARPIPATKKDAPTQAADFIAYEVRTAFMDLEVKAGQLFEGFRKSFLLMGQISNRWGDLKAHNICAELSQRNIPRRH